MANVYKRVSGAWVVDNDYKFVTGGGTYTNSSLTNGYLRYSSNRWSIQTYSNKGSLKYLTIPVGTPKKFKLTTTGLPYVFWNYTGISAGQPCYDAPSPISTTQNGNTYVREYDLTSLIGSEYTVNIVLTADYVQSSVGATNYNGTYSGEAPSGWGTGTIHQATNNAWS